MAFHVRFDHEDATPANPPTFRAAVPSWAAETRSRSGETGRSRVDFRPASDEDDDSG
jgi:hypothetical protein